MNLKELINKYRDEGLTLSYAISKVCQDIIINKIANSKYKNKITIKGGVVMLHLTNNIRRVTRDIDMDFINMSIANDNILKIILNLSNVKTNDELELSMDESKIEELNHEDYKGKRIIVIINDKYGNREEIKVDIGVHKNTDICQNELILDTAILENNITFLANPIEQIVVEKLMPIVKFRELSSRYKDIFDIYWIVTNRDINKYLLMLCMEKNIFRETNISNLSSLIEILRGVFNSKIYINGIEKSNNWLDINAGTIFEVIIDYFETLEEMVEV